MLVLTRKQQQQICIGKDIVITVLKVRGNAVRIGIEAPREMRVTRAELPTLSDAEGKENGAAGQSKRRTKIERSTGSLAAATAADVADPPAVEFRRSGPSRSFHPSPDRPLAGRVATRRAETVQPLDLTRHEDGLSPAFECAGVAS